MTQVGFNIHAPLEYIQKIQQVINIINMLWLKRRGGADFIVHNTDAPDSRGL